MLISNDDQVGLLSFNQSDNVVQTIFDKQWLLTVSLGVGLLSASDILSNSCQTLLLLLLGFRAVLVQQFEQVCSSVLVQSIAELSNGWWDLETLVKDNTLTLETNVFGPFNESGQITGRLNVLTDCERAGALLEAGILWCLAGGLGLAVRVGSWLLCSFSGLGLCEEKGKKVSSLPHISKKVIGGH